MTRSYSSMSGSNSSANYLSGPENLIVRQTNKTNQQPFKSTTIATGLANQQLMLEMPKSLHYRNFMEFPQLKDDIRVKLFSSLKSYIEYVKSRADYHSNLLPRDHRSRSEKERASKIWKNVRPQGNTKGSVFFAIHCISVCFCQMISLCYTSKLSIPIDREQPHINPWYH